MPIGAIPVSMTADAAIAQFKAFTGFTGIKDVGVFTATGEENKSEAKLAEIKAFAAAL